MRSRRAEGYANIFVFMLARRALGPFAPRGETEKRAHIETEIVREIVYERSAISKQREETLSRTENVAGGFHRAVIWVTSHRA